MQFSISTVVQFCGGYDYKIYFCRLPTGITFDWKAPHDENWYVTYPMAVSHHHNFLSRCSCPIMAWIQISSFSWLSQKTIVFLAFWHNELTRAGDEAWTSYVFAVFQADSWLFGYLRGHYSDIKNFSKSGLQWF